jgi:hypothetical protein
MTKRPIPLIIVSVAFIAIGFGSLFKGVWPVVKGGMAIGSHELTDSAIVAVSGIVAMLSGVFMLRGANWARWLCIAWMAFHVVISMLHNPFELVIHAIILVVLVLVLFWGSTSTYFHAGA